MSVTDPLQIREEVMQAARERRALRIRGSGSKDFYGNALQGEVLEAGAHAGVIDYQPGELVLTARAGTPLAQLEALLADHGQMLAFEPPRFGGAGTLGGCIASGLSGPRRAYAGAVRDFVLGMRLIDGKGSDLRFGGQVIKNVAGYDVSRLMAGAMGTLGVLLEISLKVLPRPAAERTLRFELDEPEANEKINRWAGQPVPISASCYCNGLLSVRLSGAEAAVLAAQRRLGGEIVADAAEFWNAIRDHDAEFFRRADDLWRVSVPSTVPPLPSSLPQLIEWGGALRWLSGAADAAELRRQARELGGHVTSFYRRSAAIEAFHPLDAALFELHRRIKREFDPHGILNPGRLYAF